MAMPIPATATVARVRNAVTSRCHPARRWLACSRCCTWTPPARWSLLAPTAGRVALSASIGGDLPSGVLLALTDPDAVVAARARADAGRGAGFAAPLASIVTLMFALAVEVGVLVIPLAGRPQEYPTAPDGWGRWFRPVSCWLWRCGHDW